MPERSTLKTLDDFALPLSRRTPPGPCFARLCDWSEQIRDELWRCHEMARQWGIILESRIPNPDEGQTGYMLETLGPDFEPTAAFAEAALERWMPRMSADNRRAFAEALAQQYRELTLRGKPTGALKNLYIKLMCWLYYRFERLMPLLGREDLPKLLYVTEGITAHELTLLRMLCAMGTDVLLVEPAGDEPYLRLDPESRWSQRIDVPNGVPFPEGFSLKTFRREMAPAQPNRPAPGTAPTRRQPNPPAQPATIVPENYFRPPAHDICTNAWMAEADYRQLLTPPASRGDDPKLLYNGYIRLRGVRDQLDYLGDLHRFYRQLIATGRAVVAEDGPLPRPEPEALNRIRRRSRYHSPEELTVDLAGNLPADAPEELQRLMQRAFIQVMRVAAADQPNPNRLLTAAVVLLCRIQRYHAPLFRNWKPGEVPVFILMGGCADADEALFVRWLARLPVDVLLPAPDLEKPCVLTDEALLELSGEESLAADRFPRDDATLQLSTMAAHAERDLDALLYADSGIYRNRQFARGNAVTLRTTFDELFILWDQELRYRPGFAAGEGAVSMPVLYAKISGVEGGRLPGYWQKVRRLAGEDGLFVPQLPMPCGAGDCQAMAQRALNNGRINREALKRDRRYPFGLLREELQEHLFDKVQLMLDRRLIRGTFVNGTEYTVLATALGMGKTLLRLLQAFDFTRRSPKVVCVDCRENGATLQDAILLTLLNLVGFDIALFVPTGYQTIERFLADNLPVEHQIGEYIYDLTTPSLDAMPQERSSSWLERLFRREK